MKPIPRRLIILALCFLTPACFNIKGCNADQVDQTNTASPTGPSPTPTPTVTVALQPKTVDAVPGESRRFEAAPSQSVGVFVAWTISGSALSIQEQGLSAMVKCEKVGSGTVTVLAGPLNVTPARAEAVMTCSDPVWFTLLLPAEHTVGKSPCPQPLGTIQMSNLSGRLVSVTARSESPAIVVSPGGATVGPGAGQDFTVTFTCGTTPPVTTRIVFTVVVDGVTLTYVSNVTLTRG
jgi:hypothetical protein